MKDKNYVKTDTGYQIVLRRQIDYFCMPIEIIYSAYFIKKLPWWKSFFGLFTKKVLFHRYVTTEFGKAEFDKFLSETKIKHDLIYNE